MEPGSNHCFLFHLNDRTNRGNLSFSFFMIGTMLLRGYDADITMGCSIESSKDEENHFTLLREK